ncbi:unnamed protein product [Strongylus vulgaris]|uniref:Uncharacterized protein n=1 Tax=Strongylus vulgaris TaxID=40348 RepID=A0A3P7J9M7_STRVU|nr:unnamed protein product [Strongylus vulgaris]
MVTAVDWFNAATQVVTAVFLVDVPKDTLVIHLHFWTKTCAVEPAPSCSVTLCPTSSTPFISALSLQPMQCTPNVDGACPGNFFCWFSTTATSVNAFYCCRSPDSVDTGCELQRQTPLVYQRNLLVCPPQLVPVPGDGGAQYKYCSPSAPLNDAIQGCGANRHCQYICCGLESDVRLPNVCPPQPANLVPVELAGNYRTCNP